MTAAERFYAERDRRTREYGVSNIFDKPVGIAVGPRAAATRNGQLIVLALVNCLARMHRRLHLQIPAEPLVTACIVPARRLDEAADSLARAIDPFIQIEMGNPESCSVGIGTDSPVPTPWYVGYKGAVAIVDRTPMALDTDDRPSLGAALAACMAAANLFRQVAGTDQRRVAISAWDCSEGAAATQGPQITGPLDVGTVLQAGAGGVGSCHAYWLREFGIAGRWYVADRDIVKLHNTNRSLGFFPVHAGWDGSLPRNKAEVAAELFGAENLPLWYDELPTDSFTPDLVLPLANERAVRHHVALRGEPIIFHATTSQMWESQVHRHIPDQDDCIECRMPRSQPHVQFECGTVGIQEANGETSDAALSFLSATAGILLLSALFRLQHGSITDSRNNLWAVCFNDVRRFGRRGVNACTFGCQTRLEPSVRRRIHAGRRWSHLDPATSTHVASDA